MAKTMIVRAVLYYLRAFLKKRPESRPRLLALHQKMNGLPLLKATLWRHTTLAKEPSAGTFLVYLTFLRREGAIEPNGNKSLFVYSFPELLRAKKSQRPEDRGQKTGDR